MAVYTEIDGNTLAEFAAHYPLSQIDGLKGITAGVQNSNFLLATADANIFSQFMKARLMALPPMICRFFLADVAPVGTGSVMSGTTGTQRWRAHQHSQRQAGGTGQFSGRSQR